MTWPTPTLKLNGLPLSRDESNFLPFCNVPKPRNMFTDTISQCYPFSATTQIFNELDFLLFSFDGFQTSCHCFVLVNIIYNIIKNLTLPIKKIIWFFSHGIYTMQMHVTRMWAASCIISLSVCMVHETYSQVTIQLVGLRLLPTGVQCVSTEWMSQFPLVHNERGSAACRFSTPPRRKQAKIVASLLFQRHLIFISQRFNVGKQYKNTKALTFLQHRTFSSDVFQSSKFAHSELESTSYNLPRGNTGCAYQYSGQLLSGPLLGR